VPLLHVTVIRVHDEFFAADLFARQFFGVLAFEFTGKCGGRTDPNMQAIAARPITNLKFLMPISLFRSSRRGSAASCICTRRRPLAVFPPGRLPWRADPTRKTPSQHVEQRGLLDAANYVGLGR